MQYFLKAALGPNLDIDKITIFDPVLFQDNEASKNIEDRYRSCFSEQLNKRLVFLPQDPQPERGLHGTLKHFVRALKHSPKALFW